MRDPNMKDHVHLVQFGTGDRRMSTGEYEGQPAFFVEPVPAREIGIASGDGGPCVLADGSLVLRFSRPESIAVFAEMAAKLAAEVRAEPAMRRLSEAECFCLEAAEHYGFTGADDGVYTATEGAIVDLVRAAREQGRRDAGAEPKEWPMPLANDYAALARGMDAAQNRLIDEALAIYAGLAPAAQARFREQMVGLTTPSYTGPNPCAEIILDRPKDDQP